MATFQTFLDEVKREVKQSNATLDSFILDKANQGLREYARIHNYEELLVPDAHVTLMTATNYAALPSDFLRFNSAHSITFNETADSSWLLRRSTGRIIAPTGLPIYFKISGKRIYFTPYTEVLATHWITVTYYKSPTPIVLTTDLWPVDALYDVVLQFVLKRVAGFQDSKLYAVREKEEKQSFIHSTT